MNIKMLRLVQRAIEMKPREFTMALYGAEKFARPLDCNTTACIAGWAILLAGRHKEAHNVAFSEVTVASEVLGLTTAEQRGRVFWV